MTVLLTSHLREAAAAKVADLEAEVARLRAAELAEIAKAAGKQVHLGNDYWEPRERAERKLAAARRVLAAVGEG